MRERLPILVLCCAALVAAAAEIRIAAGEGVGLSPDSVVYIAAARQIAAGKGVSTPTPAGWDRPLAHFPPVYPLLLAILVRLCPLHFFAAARWLNAGLFGALAAIIGTWVYGRAGRSLVLAAGAVVLILSSLDLLRVYTMLWSEALFLPCTFAGLWLVDAYLERPSRRLLFSAAFLTAAAWLTRYAGIAGFIAGALAIVCGQHQRFSRKFADSAIFAAVAGLPETLWLIRNQILTHHATTRHFAFHPLVGQLSRAATGAVSVWLFQGRLPPAAAAGAGAALLAIFGMLYVKYKDRVSRPTRFRLPLIFSACYLAMIVVMAMFFEADLLGRVEADRILCPLHIALVVVLLTALSDREWPPGLRKAAGLAAAAAVVLFGLAAKTEIRTLSQYGQQYAAGAWRDSPTIAYVAHLSPAMHVYTNGALPVYLYADRSCYEIPPKVFSSTLQSNPDYAALMDRIRDEVRGKMAVVVYFQREYRPEFPSADELSGLFRARGVQTEDGILFGA